MMGNRNRKLLALLITAALLISLTACGGILGDDYELGITLPKLDLGGIALGEQEESSEATDEPWIIPTVGATEQTEPAAVTKLEAEDLSYVLVYNPNIYYEGSTTDYSKLNTGDISSQIEIDYFRGEGLTEEPEVFSISQDVLNADIPWEELNLDGNRNETQGIDYQLGDRRTFYASSRISMDYRTETKFECVYAGEYCYVWSTGEANPELLREYGREFDENVYLQTVEAFGMPRFVGESGKVNLLCYGLPSGIGGYFCGLDLCSESEMPAEVAAYYGMNTNHAILHLNADLITDTRFQTYMQGTMAHELQHLICATDAFFAIGNVMCSTWLNEAMSGYIEENLYPGSKEAAGHYDSLLYSDFIRYGQSMYNFGNEPGDVGVYGSVYLFAEYLAALAGDDVFSNIHTYWRESYSDTLCEAEALLNVVPAEVRSAIDDSLAYPGGIEFASAEEEWMSKLILDFYVSMLEQEDSVEAYNKIDPRYLTYDSLWGADIEGGGRILIEVKGDAFEIPQDADTGLVYIGFNSDFQVVTEYIFA